MLHDLKSNECALTLISADIFFNIGIFARACLIFQHSNIRIYSNIQIHSRLEYLIIRKVGMTTFSFLWHILVSVLFAITDMPKLIKLIVLVYKLRLANKCRTVAKST